MNLSLDYPSSNNLIGDGPEGPEVRAVADQLNAELTGEMLFGLEWDSQSRYAREELSGYSEIGSKFPARIERLSVKGKQIFWIFESVATSEKFYLVSFLGMEGKWIWEPETHSNLRLNLGNRFLYYDDSRHFGSLVFHSTFETVMSKIKDLGPDVLAYALFLHGQNPSFPSSDQITPEVWRSAFQNKRLGKKEVGVFLMDQKRFCGIGNYLCAEMLYAARVSPLRLLNTLTEVEIERLRQSILDLIYRAYTCRGNTIKSFRTPHGEKGTFECLVYRKETCPLGHPVIKTQLKDKRFRHWVPTVQV